jgi:hypothetical protein
MSTTQECIRVYELDRNISELLLLVQGSPEWDGARLCRLTASVAAQAIGCLPFATADQLIKRKCSSERPPPTEAQLRGIESEPHIVQEYLAQQQIRGVSFTEWTPGLFVHPQEPWLAASPDRVLQQADGSIRLLEVKNLSQNHSALPDWVYIQVGFNARQQQLILIRSVRHIAWCCRYWCSWASPLQLACFQTQQQQ